MSQKRGKHNNYFGNIKEGFLSSLKGLQISIKHAWQARQRRKPFYISDPAYFDQKEGIVTLEYPYEAIPVPDHGRYRLYNEMDDCIVCDKCAKICPVDCIDIEPIKATEQVGTASDGSPIRLYAETFDIDMAKCCYCGLCTTVCPTDCLTMTKAYDYSEEDVSSMVYHFSNLSPEEAEEKKQLLIQFQKEKAEAKKQAAAQEKAAPKPKIKAKAKTTSNTKEGTESKPKPKFKPKVKAKAASSPSEEKTESKTEAENKSESQAKPRPKFKPKMKAKIASKPSEEKSEAKEETENKSESQAKPRPKFKPKMKAKIKPKTPPQNEDDSNDKEA